MLPNTFQNTEKILYLNFFFLSVNIKDQKYLVLTAERATSKPDPSHGEESICTGCDHQAWTVQI